MKKLTIKLLSIVASVFLFSGCGEPIYERGIGCTWYYINNSGHDVVVIWNHGPERFVVKNGETHTLSTGSTGSGFPYSFGYADEASIIFDNSRILMFALDGKDGVVEEDNIFWMYELIRKEIHDEYNYTEYHYQYTFTPEMYERAVPIDDAEEPEIPE